MWEKQMNFNFFVQFAADRVQNEINSVHQNELYITKGFFQIFNGQSFGRLWK